MEDEEIKKYIFEELSKLEFAKYSKGFTYLNEAIFLCIKNIGFVNNLNKNVYTYIAKKYNESSVQNVKGCIEQAIKAMYNNTETEILQKYFYINKYEKPSLKLIICIVMNKYEWNIKKNKKEKIGSY